MKRLLKNKRKLIVLGIVLLILITVPLFLFINKDKKEVINDLKVIYYEGDVIEFLSNDEEIIKEITIKNTSKDLKTYSLIWDDVSNDFEEQSKLLYTIKATGKTAAELQLSQVPIADAKVFNSVAILSGQTHTYEIKITYNGQDKNKKFTGKIKVDSKSSKKTKSKSIIADIEQASEKETIKKLKKQG